MHEMATAVATEAFQNTMAEMSQSHAEKLFELKLLHQISSDKLGVVFIGKKGVNWMPFLTQVKVKVTRNTKGEAPSAWETVLMNSTDTGAEWLVDENERFLKETNQDKGYMPNRLFCSRFTDVWDTEVRNVAHVARTQLFAGEIV